MVKTEWDRVKVLSLQFSVQIANLGVQIVDFVSVLRCGVKYHLCFDKQINNFCVWIEATCLWSFTYSGCNW